MTFGRSGSAFFMREYIQGQQTATLSKVSPFIKREFCSVKRFGTSATNITVMSAPTQFHSCVDGIHRCYLSARGYEMATDSKTVKILKRILFNNGCVVGLERFYLRSKVIAQGKREKGWYPGTRSNVTSSPSSCWGRGDRFVVVEGWSGGWGMPRASIQQRPQIQIESVVR